MVTNYPISSHDGADRRNDAHMEEIGVWAVRADVCGLHGHDTLLHFEQDRMSLRCVSCGHETPGWELNEARPRVTVRGDARRHAMRPHLMSVRRIA